MSAGTLAVRSFDHLQQFRNTNMSGLMVSCYHSYWAKWCLGQRVLNGEGDVRRDDSDSESDAGITFTVKPRSDKTEEVKPPACTPTAVETLLPWKRNTGRPPISCTSSFMQGDVVSDQPSICDLVSWADDLNFGCLPPSRDVADTAVGAEGGKEVIEEASSSPRDPPHHNKSTLNSDLSRDISSHSFAWLDSCCNSPADTDWKLGASCVPNADEENLVEADTNEVTIPPPWRAQELSGDQCVPVLSPAASHDLDSILPQASTHSIRLSEAESRHSEHLHAHMHHMIELPRRPTISSELMFVVDDLEDEDELYQQMDSMERVERWLFAHEAAFAERHSSCESQGSHSNSYEQPDPHEPSSSDHDKSSE